MLLLLVFSIASSRQTEKLKVYISVDMEGIAGVVSDDQLGPGAFEYERFRNFMTKEALAAVTAAKESGATEILVSDSHGNGENLLIEQFPKEVRVIRSWPRHLGMMAGIDATFDAVLFIGYHSSTANKSGVRAHTFSSARLTSVRLNGKEVTEGLWNAAIAGELNVPVVFVSGDDAACAELRAVLASTETAEVKKSLGFHSANTLTPEASQELIAKSVKSALRRRREIRPFKISAPITLDLSFKHYRVAELLTYLSLFERTESHAIRFVGKNMAELSDAMNFITSYRYDLEP
jgi:D-amino peptidase